MKHSIIGVCPTKPPLANMVIIVSWDQNHKGLQFIPTVIHNASKIFGFYYPVETDFEVHSGLLLTTLKTAD